LAASFPPEAAVSKYGLLICLGTNTHELRNEIKQSKQTVRKMRKYLSSVKREKGSEKGKVERIKVK
jgi:hypothetical protein